MASRKKTTKKKNSPRPKLGVIDHLIALFEEIISYFEVLFIYIKKQFNLSLRSAILSCLIITYFFFLLFTGSLFLLYSAYLTVLSFTNENPVMASAILGWILVLLSLIFLRYFLKKISL